LDDARECTRIFWTFMKHFHFTELSAEGQRLVIEQRVLAITREIVDGIVKLGRGNTERDAFFWLWPVDPMMEEEAEEEMVERELTMEIDGFSVT
jgi:hypothetical protein